MKNAKIFILFVGFIFLSSLVFAQVPSPLKDVEVSARVIFDNKTGIYTYSYEVYNPPINTSQIFSFDVDISSGPGDANFSRDGLINGPCYNKYGSEYLFQRIKMVPVGIDGPREYIPEHLARGFKVTIWSCGLSIESLAGWGSMESYRIPPSKKMGSFILTSYAIPGIRDAKIQPDIDYDNLPDEYYGNVELTKQLQDSLIYSTKTIGPTAPPANFKPIEFLDYIIGLKHEAAFLGWITNKGIENSLDKKLDKAKKKLQQGNTTAAKNILNAFLKEVESQGCKSPDKCPKGKHLTPEAYGLLKYNVQYLIELL